MVNHLPAIYQGGAAPELARAATLPAPAPGIDLPTVDTVAAADLYGRWLESRSLAPSTVYTYTKAVRFFNEHIGTFYFGIEDVVRMLLAVDLGRNSKAWLVNALRRFFRWLSDAYGVEDRSCYIPEVKPQKSLPRVLSVREIHAAFAATRDDVEETMLLLMLDTGIRVGEAANLRAHYIMDGWMEVDGKTGPRQIPISEEIADRLLAISRDDGVIWVSRGNTAQNGIGAPKTVDGLKKQYVGIFRRAGIKHPGRPSGPHVLRHTFATYFLKAGGNILSLQNILGHSHISTTMVYLHLASDHHQAEHTLYTPARTLGLIS